MDWQQQLESALEQRDKLEQGLLPYFLPFEIASARAAVADVEKLDTAQMDSQKDTIKALTSKRHDLEVQLAITRRQLEQAQERARLFAEEQYMKTHAVKGLHDEILALTMQLSLSEDKRKKLQDELGR